MSEYTEETLDKMIEKAKTSFDAVDFTRGVTICASSKCPRKSECFRYAICDRLRKNKINGHTMTLFVPENCIHFIAIKSD
jgi:hypothetical protein